MGEPAATVGTAEALSTVMARSELETDPVATRPLPPWRAEGTPGSRPGGQTPPGSTGGAGGRAHRRLRRLARSLLVVVVVVVLATGVLLAVTPSTGDAPRRVAARAAAAAVPPLAGPLPGRVVAALVATEDSRFYHHYGVDPRGAVRGTFGPLLRGDGGGATLDQQLVKILYTGGRRGLVDRVEQVALAVKLDARFSKDEILRLYLDTVYFGHGYYGVTAAARGYFGRDPGRLTWAQASLLAGLVQAPSAYDPLTHLAAARARQRHILDRLVATGRLSRPQADAVATDPLGLR